MEKMNYKLYHAGDMARIGCGDCQGCSDCCRGMGNSIILDPFDVFELCTGLQTNINTLLADKLELQVQEGIVLPNIKMQEHGEQCGFLDENGRCSVHAYRPGLCRLFPLGREYKEGNLFYFVLEGACPNSKAKVKIEKWMGKEASKKHEAFLVEWHYLLTDHMERVKKRMAESEPNASDDDTLKWNMLFLQLFYMTPFDETQDFYKQFEERVTLWNTKMREV